MKTKKRLKLCLNCNGQVDIDVIVCPFCGSDLMEEKNVKEDPAPYDISHGTLNSEKTIASLYPPPYQPGAFQAPHPEEKAAVQEAVSPPSPSVSVSVEEEKAEVVATMTPILLFSIGVNLFLFGAMLFLFSENGTLHLKFNSSLWFFYVILSMPLAYFGFKKLSKLD